MSIDEQPDPNGGAEPPANEGGVNNDPPAAPRASERIRMARANLVSPAALLLNHLIRGGGDPRPNLDPEDPFEEAGEGGEDDTGPDPPGAAEEVDAVDEDAPQGAGADAPVQAPVQEVAAAAEAAEEDENEGAAGGDGGFPSIDTCPLVQEPPADGVTFMNSDQAFERSAIFRHIGTRGSGAAYRSVLHPTTRESMGREEALATVRPLPDERRAACAQERRRLGLSVDDENPINDADRQRYERTMRRVNERYVSYVHMICVSLCRLV